MLNAIRVVFFAAILLQKVLCDVILFSKMESGIKTVLITGTSNGIGKSTALLFLGKGYQVIGFDLESFGKEFAAWVEQGMYIHHFCDVSKLETFPELKERAIEIIINNAGVLDENDASAISVNLMGTININRTYYQPKITKAILNMASISGHTGMAPQIYSAAQGGILAYSKRLAQDLAQYGTVVNTISPGGVLTRMNQAIIENPQLIKKCYNETLLKKWATANECADLIYFLTATNKSITGQDVIIDNGEQIKQNYIEAKPKKT